MINFPPKYYIIFSNSPEDEIHRSRIIAGLRIALTLLMEEFEIHILLIQEGVAIAKKSNGGNEREEKDDEINFTPYELIEGLISFGGNVMTCKSSLAMVNMTKEDLIQGVEIFTLHTALLKMVDCDKVLTF
ncbi:MAG: DsrE family protein [Candidatus Thorarchaeota archaeon]